jgi:hypothetical protein
MEREMERVRSEARAALAEDVTVDLASRSLVRLGGEEFESFLQNLLAGDVREVLSGATRLSAHCTVKGRVLTLYRAFPFQGEVLLEAPRATLEGTLKKLTMMILRAKVSARTVDEELESLGIAGEGAAGVLSELGWPAPEGDDDVQEIEGVLVARLPGHRPRFQVVAPREVLATARETAERRARPVGAEAWELLEVRAGHPEVYPETSEAFLPQFLNLEVIGGVRFDKGCFPGQEVVARTQNLGSIVRRLYRARVDVEERPEPGAPLRAVSGDRAKDGGRVVRAARNGDGAAELLAVVPVKLREEGAEIRLGADDGPALRFETHPHEVASEG